MLSPCMEKLVAAKLQIALNHTFFSTVASELRFIEHKTATLTCGTDGSRVYANPQYVAGRNMAEMMFILCHTLLHVVLLHPQRRGSRDKLVWDIATDLAVNLILVKCGLVAPPKALIDPKFEGMTAEKIYDELMKDARHINVHWASLDDHALWDKPDGVPPPGQKAQDLGPTLTPEQIREIAVGAFELSKMCGKMPAGLERMFDQLMAPKVNWRQVLYRFIEQLEQDDYTYDRHARRYEPHGVYLPTLRDQDGLHLGIGFDTSGSISDQDLTRFVSELIAICRQKMLVKIFGVICDAAVHEVFEIDNTKTVQEIVEYVRACMKGGGGTDMNPIIDVFDKLEKFNAGVIFTDGFWPDPAPPKTKIKILWCLTHDRDIPFGRKLLIEEGER